jgi:DNA polymerase-4
MMACVRIPQFAAAVEIRENPELGEIPLIVVETIRQKERVYAASEACSKTGVRTGMHLRQAQSLCPGAHLVVAEYDRYRQMFDEFLEILSVLSPSIESGDPDPSAIVYLGLADQKHREPVDIAQTIGQTIREEALLAPALGLAVGKFPAYVAASAIEPNSALIIAPEQEGVFLNPFPVDVLPLDAETARRLNLFGIRTLGQLAELSVSAIQAQFGKQGRFLQKLARGQDDRPLVLHRPVRGEEVLYQCDDPVTDWRVLENILRASIVELSRRLHDRGMAAQQVRLVLRMEDGRIYDDVSIVSQPAWGEEGLMSAVIDLVNRASISSGILELEIHLDQLVPAVGHQLELFAGGAKQEAHLRDVLKDLAKRHGSRCFYRILLDSQDEPVLESRFRFRQADGS